jgi:NADH-quinone oxidoreductase subunit H
LIFLIRATFPRLRFDQFLSFGWKVMMPLVLLNLLATAAVVLVRAK